MLLDPGRWLGALFPARPLRALFIGNSLTHYEAAAPGGSPLLLNDLPGLLSRMSRSRGEARVLAPGRVSADGASLEDHWDGGRPQRELRPGAWDLVVLQENSERAVSQEAALRRDVRRWRARIEEAGARTALFSTWTPAARSSEAPRLNRACEELAGELGAELVPVGRAWQAARAARPELALAMEDGLHPAPLGAYLSACVFYARLYGAARLGPSAEAAEDDADAVRALCRTHARRAAGLPAPEASEPDLAFLRGVAARAAREGAGIEAAVPGGDG